MLSITVVKQVFGPETEFQIVARVPGQIYVDRAPARRAVGINTRVLLVPGAESALVVGEQQIGLQTQVPQAGVDQAELAVKRGNAIGRVMIAIGLPLLASRVVEDAVYL